MITISDIILKNKGDKRRIGQHVHSNDIATPLSMDHVSRSWVVVDRKDLGDPADPVCVYTLRMD